MKSVNVIRRIDYLGRVVIPNDIRKTLNLNVNDHIEFEVLDNKIILKKYSVVKNIENATQIVLKSLTSLIDKPLLILDLENVILTSDNASEFKGKKITIDAFNIIKEKKNISISVLNSKKLIKLFVGDSLKYKSQTIIPIISQKNESLGAIVLLDKEESESNAEEIKLLKMASQIIAMGAEL